MIKKNGDNKWQLDGMKFVSTIIKLVLVVIAGVGGYYATIGRITTAQAVQKVRQNQFEVNLGDQCARFMIHEEIQREDFGKLSDKLDDLKDLIIERMP